MPLPGLPDHEGYDVDETDRRFGFYLFGRGDGFDLLPTSVALSLSGATGAAPDDPSSSGLSGAAPPLHEMSQPGGRRTGS